MTTTPGLTRRRHTTIGTMQPGNQSDGASVLSPSLWRHPAQEQPEFNFLGVYRTSKNVKTLPELQEHQGHGLQEAQAQDWRTATRKRRRTPTPFLFRAYSTGCFHCSGQQFVQFPRGFTELRSIDLLANLLVHRHSPCQAASWTPVAQILATQELSPSRSPLLPRDWAESCNCAALGKDRDQCLGCRLTPLTPRWLRHNESQQQGEHDEILSLSHYSLVGLMLRTTMSSIPDIWIEASSFTLLVHFWAPPFKWSISIANIADFTKPQEKLSYPQQIDMIISKKKKLQLLKNDDENRHNIHEDLCSQAMHLRHSSGFLVSLHLAHENAR
ncbi:hypothetical protein Cgig2_000792 [Carnegiea gigantea]|uniref:Mitochondrial pyruvate carrier n=1 Tax=Carnegiea gigantea TaxID=171969 RepID=A0A9Q1GRL5_9CARY|nr:hypothetical protein Cgig2_000792 [Carnegiea gigantea]